MASSISSWYDVTNLSSTSGSATTAATTTTDETSVEETFMHLLVAQIKNQNPLSPTDSVEFLSQLVQINQLEQTIGIRDDLSVIYDSVSADSSADASEGA